MTTVRGCDIPEALFYDVESNIWARPETDGTVTVGMTSYGCCLAGPLVAFTPRRVGKEIRRGRSCATVESGKWVGPINAPVGGEIVAINELLLDSPGTINRDPYASGWLLRLRPTDWAVESTALLTGAAALTEFGRRMEEDGFDGC